MTCLVLPSDYHLSPNGYLWYVLDPQLFKNLPRHIQVEGMLLELKNEFHVTILNITGTALEISIRRGGDIRRIQLQLIELFIQYIKENDINFICFLDDIRLAKSGNAKSLAASCLMTGCKGYYKMIHHIFGVMLDQPHHVSLYTKSGKAVGIDTHKKMHSFPKVGAPDVQMILDIIGTPIQNSHF